MLPSLLMNMVVNDYVSIKTGLKHQPLISFNPIKPNQYQYEMCFLVNNVWHGNVWDIFSLLLRNLESHKLEQRPINGGFLL